MQVMALRQPGPVTGAPLRLTRRDVPLPGVGEIRLRVGVCGVCHTDLHTVEGDLALPRLPLVPGHQIVGRVEACGAGVEGYQTGERVGVGWLASTCGACHYCRHGHENLCPEARFTGLHVDGGYSEFTIVDARFAYRLPPAYDDETAAPLLCAGVVGFRALRLCGVRPGQRLGLYGFGASAHLVIQVARHWDCEVYVFTRSEHHRRLALDLGAAWVGGAEDAVDPALHAGILFAPAGWLVPVALAHLRPGGTLAINAIHTSPIPEMPYARLYGERVLRSVTNFTRQDARDFLDLAGTIPLKIETTSYPLDAANEALRALKKSVLKAAAVLRVNEA